MIRRVLTIAAVAGLAAGLAPGVLAAQGRPAPPGCGPRHAQANQAGTAAVSPGPAPLVCETQTGFGGAETRIAVSSDGTVVYEPATVTPGLAGTGFVPGAPGPRPSTSLQPGGLALSRDHGATWRFVKPAGLTWVAQDDQLYVDRRTGRIFYYALSPNPAPQSGAAPVADQEPAGHAHLMASGDDGRTWSYAALSPYVESENPRFAAGPPAAHGPRPVNYPDVTYWCGNDMLFYWAAPDVPAYRACYRSLDGGRSWSQTSLLFSRPLPAHPECGTNSEVFDAGDGNYPEPAPDGSLYVTVHCGSATFLARSTDEASSWPILHDRHGRPLVIPATDELRVDERGNLYSLHQDGARLLLRTSRDGGLDWSAPVNLTAPGVTSIAEWYAAERGSEIAVSYLGATSGSADLDGYISATRDALSPRPLLWSATVNPPGHPLVQGAPAQARDDFIGADIGPDGTPWASFFTSCPSGSTSPGCAGQSGDPQASGAVAGWLQFPSG
ncbi:MAG TPA: sialidase family protein [Acidimicrobiales bacterium]|nr:sialidase family protein [Acidimicrobiales bacterium]